MASRHSRYGEIVKAFGKAVRLFRLKSGCSQEVLADRAKLDRSYMSQIERGIKNATLNSIWTISSALEVRPSELLAATETLIGIQPADSALNAHENLAAANAADNTSTGQNLSESTVALATPTPVDSTPMKSQLVLVVDDDSDICAAIGSVLKDAGFDVCSAPNGMEAIRFLSTHNIKAIVSDVRMSHGNGFELLEMVRNYFPSLPLFLITGYDDVSEEDAKRRGANGLFNKPFDLAAFVSSVKSSLTLPGDPVH
jgi:CheY-like chemotaxis protein/transcriptional regulator with XRE-family HTH domain